MALHRNRMICPFCDQEIKWISNPPTGGFVGDTGGKYDIENHFKQCDGYISTIRDRKLEDFFNGINSNTDV